jgi:WD40 repeat protein
MKTRILMVIALVGLVFQVFAQLEYDKALLEVKHKIVCSNFSPDGKYVAASTNNGDIIVWNQETGNIYKTLVGIKALSKSVAFTRDNKYLVSGGKDNNITIWNLAIGEKHKVLKAHKGEVFSIDISRNDKLIASASADNSIIIWNLVTGEAISKLVGHSKEVLSVDFSNNGKKLISSSGDKTIKEWNVETGDQIKSINAHENAVRTVKYSPNGKYIASAGYDRKIHIWNSNGEKLNTFLGHSKWVMSIAFSPDSKYLMSGAQDAYILVWDIKSASIVYKSKKQKAEIYSVAFNHDGRKGLSTALFSSQVDIWNASKLNIAQISDEKFADEQRKGEIKAEVNWINPTSNISSSNAIYRIKACIKSESDISNIDVYLNDGLFSSDVGSNIFATTGECNIDFEKNIYLKQGSNNIKVIVKNEAGETESEVRNITYSMIAKPLISWVEPHMQKTATSTPSMKITANITSKAIINKVEVFNNNQLVLTENGLTSSIFTKKLALNVGINSIKIVATSTSGSTSSEIRTINYALAAKPLISWNMPNGIIDETFISSYNISADIKSESKLLRVEVFVNDILQSFDENPVITNSSQLIYSFERSIHLNEGNNQVKLVALNSSGQTISQIKTITYKIPKEMVIRWINPGYSNTNVFNSNFELKACVKSSTKVHGISLFVNNILHTNELNLVSSESSDCTVNYMKVIQLNQGENLIRLEAKNAAGSIQSEIRNIVYEIPLLAQISWTNPIDLSSSSSESNMNISACIKSNSNINYAKLFINGLQYAIDENLILAKNEICHFNYTKNIQLQNGINEIKLAVSNLAGEVVSEILSVNYSESNPYLFALIIGNENYSDYQVGLESESDVDFAISDAKAFKEQAINTLGVSSENIIYLENARYIEMRRALKKMNLYAKNTFGKGEFIFYYAGHGFPDEKTKEPYLVPVDGNGTDLEFSAIKLKDVYQNFTEYPSQKITVFLDACFSGGARNQGLVAARGVKIKPKEETDAIKSNLVVFTASSGNQSSLPYKEKQHGMFTYFLVNKLKESNGNVSFKELSDYLKEQVSIKSIMINNKEQSPQTNVSPAIQDIWGDWKLK